jgi:hypothetical protein
MIHLSPARQQVAAPVRAQEGLGADLQVLLPVT